MKIDNSEQLMNLLYKPPCTVIKITILQTPHAQLTTVTSGSTFGAYKHIHNKPKIINMCRYRRSSENAHFLRDGGATQRTVADKLGTVDTATHVSTRQEDNGRLQHRHNIIRH